MSGLTGWIRQRFSSVSQAEAAGYTDFYIDITHFWGMDAGWLRVTDSTPLKDAAIPSGCEEMYLTAEYLYRNFPDRPEGELTRMRADMVCETSLAAVAAKIELGKHLQLGHGEEQGGGRGRDSILADAVESVIAACYLDGGMDAARQFVDKFVLTNVPVTRLHNRDYKTGLQELVQQKKNQTLSYRLTGESGPDHDKRFEVEVSLNGRVIGVGSGSSKKRAEQMAAQVALENL